MSFISAARRAVREAPSPISFRSALRDSPALPDDARHVIDRLTFGSTKALRDELAADGADAFIRRQLDPASIGDGECDEELARFSRLYKGGAKLISDGDSQWEVQNELLGMTVVRSVRSRRQLLELMVDFWSNHLSVNSSKHQVAFLLADDNTVTRRLALGRFDQLLMASAASPSMLAFLDNRTSRADGVRPPNENYARELLEIHTLGQADAFSEADVEAVAHVFTGWTTDPNSREFVFRGDWNRLGPAASRETLGWSPVAADGSRENGTSLLSHLARHPTTARNLCHKLCRHFIRDDIGASDDAVARVAEAYLASDTDIAATLATLFATDAFRSSAGARVRRPNELICAMLRATDARMYYDEGVQRFSRKIREEFMRLGMVTFESPSPKGYPFEDRAWTDASSLIGRWNLAFRVAANRADGARVDFGDLAVEETTAGAFVDEICGRLLGTTLPSEEREHLLVHLGAREDSAVDGRMRKRVPALIGLTLASPSFQVR